MTLIDYHNHTSLCGHATGTIEESVKSAISKGIQELGISDHAPLPPEMRKNITMSEEQVEGYITEVTRLMKQYRSKIRIRLGFEVDFPTHNSFPSEYYNHPDIDYLIGSCHYLDDWPFDHPEYKEEFTKRNVDKVYEEYFDVIEKIISSDLFDIIGHFDLIKKFGHRPKKNFDSLIKRISGLAASKNTVIEINTSGLLKPVGEVYPSCWAKPIGLKSG